MASKRRKSADGGASGIGTQSTAAATPDRRETRSMTAARSLTPSTPTAATDSPPKRRRATPSTTVASTGTAPRRGQSAATESPPMRGGPAETGTIPRRGRSAGLATTDSPLVRGGSAGAAMTGSNLRRGRSAGLATPSPEPTTTTKVKKGRKPKKEVGQGSTMAEGGQGSTMVEAYKQDVLLGLKTEETTKTEAGEGPKMAEIKEAGEGSKMAETKETGEAGEGSKMEEIKEYGEGSTMAGTETDGGSKMAGTEEVGEGSKMAEIEETGEGSKMAEIEENEEGDKTTVEKGKTIAKVEERGSGSAAKPFPTIIIEYCTRHDIFVTRAVQVKLALEKAAPGISVLLNPNGAPKERCFKIQIEGGDTCIDFKNLESPFTLLTKNDAQKFASNVLGRIQASN